MKAIPTALVLLFMSGCGGLGEGGTAPRLTPITDPYVQVGEKLTVLVTATNPDGGDLTFKISGRPAAAQFVALDDGRSAVFSWIPEVTDAEAAGKAHVVEFFVLDDDGLWDSQEVTITVMPQAAAQFLNPPGYVLDLAEVNAMEFLVAVKDDSATQVDITIADGPVGAYIEQSSNKQAYFFWRPTDEQISQKLFWYVRFKAIGYAPDPARPGQQDQLYQLVHDIAIVITNPDYAGCPGTPPVVEHEVLADQHPAMGATGYPVAVEVQEADSEVQKAEFYWSTSPSAAEADYESVKLISTDGSNFGGEIPLVGSSQGTLLRYYLRVFDNDDFGGTTCDHQVRVPKDGHFVTAVYAAGADGACLEDSYEPNDAFAEAYFLMDPGSYPELRICGDDTDYFGFMASGNAMNVTLQAHGNGDSLVWQAQDGMGNPVAGLQSGSQSVSVPGEKLTGGVLLVALWSDNEQPVTYDLTVQPETMDCSDDALEPNESPGQAELVGPGTFADLTICAGDIDTFRLEVPGGTHVTATVTHAAAAGDLDVYLLGSDGQTVLDAAETSAKEEVVEVSAAAGGTYYLRVVGYQGATNTYHLGVVYAEQADSCQEDTFAPNQYLDEAQMVPPASYSQLTACPGKEDWFAIGLNGGETLDLKVTSGSGVQLHLENGSGTPLCTGKPQGGGVGLSCPIPSPGTYRFAIANPSGLAVTYGLEVEVTNPPGPCPEDRYENNDLAGNGAQLVNPVTTWLTACGTDSDWFYFSGYSQDLVFVGLVFDPSQGNVEVTLFDDSSVYPLGTSNSLAGKPYVEASLSWSGTYYVLVEGTGAGATVPYSLFLWVN